MKVSATWEFENAGLRKRVFDAIVHVCKAFHLPAPTIKYSGEVELGDPQQLRMVGIHSDLTDDDLAELVRTLIQMGKPEAAASHLDLIGDDATRRRLRDEYASQLEHNVLTFPKPKTGGV